MNTIKVEDLSSKGNVRAVQSSKRNKGYKALKSSIKEVGFTTPITYYIDKETSSHPKRIIIDGHQRWSIAQELGIKDIPAYESTAQNKTMRQLSANLYRVDMDILDGAVAIKQLINDNGFKSIKDLTKKLGRNADWIKECIHLGNLNDEILNRFATSVHKKEILEETDSLNALARLSHEKQTMIWDEFVDYFKLFENKFDDKEDWVWDFAKHVSRSTSSRHNYEDLLKLIPIKTIRKYEEEMGIGGSQYQNTIFEEYAKDDFPRDKDFWLEVLSKEGYILADALKTLPIDSSNWDSYMYAMDLLKLKTQKSIDNSIKKHIDCKEFKILSWNGNITQPRITVVSIVSKDGETAKEKVEDDPFRLCYNKLNKLILPIVMKEVELHTPQIENAQLNGLNTTFQWLHENSFSTAMNFEIVKGCVWNETTNEHDTIIKEPNHPLLGIDGLVDGVIIGRMSEIWFERLFLNFTYKQLNEWISLMETSAGESGIQEMEPLELAVRNEFLESREFRREYFNCFNTKQLSTKIKEIVPNMSKKAAVDIAMEKIWSDMPFEDKLFQVSSNSGAVRFYQ